MHYFLSCVRFYDDGEDQNHVYVTIEDKSNMSVDFLKQLNAQDRTDPELLCTVPIIIRRSPSQVFLLVFLVALIFLNLQ